MDWILKIKTNNNQALKEVYSLCRDECISWLQKDFGLQTDDALDVFQVSVVILYDNVMTGKLLELTSNIQTYLKGIARNKALEIIRNRKRITSDTSLPVMVQYVYEENEKMILEEQLSASLIALELIGDPCKSLLQLYYYQDLSMEDITPLMGYKNTDTTKTQKYKCLKRLQSIYYEHILKNDSIEK
ncbi:MAG: sigma-70 family RNA polymerase sigma factor [Saprospiraceae bacterium]|nr:sigma-70 family RNA polymerase sigma factor [Saprospiraceae bacterium]